MRSMFQILTVILFSTTLSADPSNEILAVDREFSKLAASQGREVAYQLYMSENPISLEQGQAPKDGKLAILQGFLPPEDGGKVTVSWEPQDGKIAKSGDVAYTWGIYTYQLDLEGNTSISPGKYLTVWVRESGSWKLAVEMSNDNPAP